MTAINHLPPNDQRGDHSGKYFCVHGSLNIRRACIDKKQGHHQSWDGQLFKEQHDQVHADSGDRETIAKRDEPDNFFKPDRTDDQCNNQ